MPRDSQPARVRFKPTPTSSAEVGGGVTVVKALSVLLGFLGLASFSFFWILPLFLYDYSFFITPPPRVIGCGATWALFVL